MMDDMERLVGLAKNGDPRALNKLYCRFKKRTVDVCCRITHDRELSEELANDAFLIAFGKLDCLKEPDKFGAWLSAIAARVALRHLKRKREDVIPLSWMEGFDVASEDSEPPLSAEELQEAIDRLPPGYRQVFTLSVIEGRQHKEIASMLNIEPHSSSSQLYHARVMLRRMLEPLLCALLLLLLIPALFVRDGTEVVPTSAELRPQGSAGSVVVCPDKRATLEKEQEIHLELDVLRQDDMAFGLDVPVSGGEVLNALHLLQAIPPLETGREEICPTVVSSILCAEERRMPRWSVTVSMSATPVEMSVIQRPYALLLPSESCASDVGGGVSIDNWGDCKRYILSNSDLFSVEVADALLRIAQSNEMDNNGQIIRLEQHAPPSLFSIVLHHVVDEPVSIHCGMGYGVYWSSFQIGVGSDRIDEQQCVSFVDIPVGLSYRFLRSSRFGFYLNAELSLQLSVAYWHNIQFVVGGQLDSFSERSGVGWIDGVGSTDEPFPPGFLSLGAKMELGVYYSLADPVGLFSQCGILYNLLHAAGVATYATAHPMGFSMQAGLQFNF